MTTPGGRSAGDALRRGRDAEARARAGCPRRASPLTPIRSGMTYDVAVLAAVHQQAHRGGLHARGRVLRDDDVGRVERRANLGDRRRPAGRPGRCGSPPPAAIRRPGPAHARCAARCSATRARCAAGVTTNRPAVPGRARDRRAPSRPGGGFRPRSAAVRVRRLSEVASLIERPTRSGTDTSRARTATRAAMTAKTTKVAAKRANEQQELACRPHSCLDGHR